MTKAVLGLAACHFHCAIGKLSRYANRRPYLYHHETIGVFVSQGQIVSALIPCLQNKYRKISKDLSLVIPVYTQSNPPPLKL